MRRILFLAAFLTMVVMSASAQKNFTVWYGANISSMSTDGTSPDSEAKFLNIGVDYTTPICNAFDWSVGAAYTTKGCKDWDPGFIQIDANAGWNFLKNDDFKLGILTGPYADLMVVKDDAEGEKTFSMGWQAGAKATYKDFSLKVGYEFGLTNVFDDGKSKLNGVYFRLGYSF